MLLAGCAMFDTAAPSAAQTTPLSWLANWVSQPAELAPGFDVESIKPDPQPTAVVAENLLEITVWDLYEPGKPYSFPVRVSQHQSIEVPFLGEVAVEGRTIAEVETLLVEGFRKGDYLLNPRILVRSLDPPMLKVQVAGAVNRGGFVELARTDPSVYAAIVSAGGLKKTAGTQVAVTRRSAPMVTVQPEIHDERPAEAPAGDESQEAAPVPAHAPALRANSLDEVSVPAVGAGHEATPGQVLFSVSDGERDNTSAAHPVPSLAAIHESEAAIWYDVTLARDREQLKRLHLGDGDVVTVKATTPPLRVSGIVNRPGAYPLPPGRSVSIWQAIELAGGVRDATVPLNITLMRPTAEGRSARRWSLSVAAYEQHPPAGPAVEHGDVLHVEPTAGGRIKRAVGDLWNKP
jgi:protein involved in polysaccharide export with SLBB domain